MGDLVRTAGKKVFSKGDSTHWSYIFYTIAQIKHNTIPSYQINYLLKRCNQNLSQATYLTLDGNNQVIEELNLNKNKLIINATTTGRNYSKKC